MKPTILLPRCNLTLDQSPGLASLSTVSLNQSKSSGRPRNHHKTSQDNNFNLYKRLKAFENQLQKSKGTRSIALQLADYTLLDSPKGEAADGVDFESILTEDSSEQNSLFQPKNDDSVARYMSEILLKEEDRSPENAKVGNSQPHHQQNDAHEAHQKSSKVSYSSFLCFRF
jgi:hypothetical protein